LVEQLGNSVELCWFTLEMAKQLKKHKKEKTSLRDVSFGDVRTLTIREIQDRVKIFANINSSKEDIEKQAVHIANYAMMLFLRSKYNV